MVDSHLAMHQELASPSPNHDRKVIDPRSFAVPSIALRTSGTIASGLALLLLHRRRCEVSPSTYRCTSRSGSRVLCSSQTDRPGAEISTWLLCVEKKALFSLVSTCPAYLSRA